MAVEANYQDPKTCSVCGEIEGEPLPPDFETYNLPLNVAQVDTEYDYVTTCGQNRDAKTVGKFRISDYYLFEGDETHPPLDGYEWHKVSFAIHFSDDNAWKWGMGVKTFWDDYYHMEPWGSSDTPSETENVDEFADENTLYFRCDGNVSR